MDIGVISVRYARALLKSATDAKQESVVYQEMMLLAKRTAVGGSESSALSKAFIALVLKEGRENMIQFMANSYVTLYRQQKNIILGKLTTATRVSAATEQKMRQMVEAKTQGTVEFETQVNPDIIGGFVLEYDTFRMDASVKSRLNAILQTLKK